jgi:hypothetical protein
MRSRGPSSLPTKLGLRDQRSMWMQDGCKSLHGFLHGIEWIMFHGHLDYFPKPPLGGRPNTKPGDHGTLDAHNRWFVLLYYVWGSAWIDIQWNGIWLRAWSHMALHYTWGSMTTLHDFGGVLGRSLDTFFWALMTSWSRLLARVWSGPKFHWEVEIKAVVSSRTYGTNQPMNGDNQPLVTNKPVEL